MTDSVHSEHPQDIRHLIIVAHPDIRHSTVNRRWLKALHEHPDRITVHELYAACPDGRVDVAAEQQRIMAHDALVLQFPVYWFNCPPLLKQWLDEVLIHGWAYGSQARAMRGRKVSLAVSMGTPASDYSAQGRIGYDVAAVLRPFELSFRYCEADWRAPFTFHTIDSNAGYDEAGLRLIDDSAADYLRWLEAL